MAQPKIIINQGRTVKEFWEARSFLLAQNTSPLTKWFPQSCRYSFFIQPPEGSSALVFSWKVLPSALSLRLSHDCPTVSFGLEFLHLVPRRLAMCLLLGVPPVFSWECPPSVFLVSCFWDPDCWSHSPLSPLSALHPDRNHDPMVPSNNPCQHVQNRIPISLLPHPPPPLKPAHLSSFFCLFWPCHTACGDLSSPALGWHSHSWFEGWHFNSWTTQDVPSLCHLGLFPFLVSPPLKYFRFAPSSPISLPQEILAPLAWAPISSVCLHHVVSTFHPGTMISAFTSTPPRIRVSLLIISSNSTHTSNCR